MTRSDVIRIETHRSPSSHYDQVFALTQIPQVVMNIDYKLEPITDKKTPHIFTTGIFILTQNYCIPSRISISLQIFAFLAFLREVVREGTYLCLFVKTHSCGRYISFN